MREKTLFSIKGKINLKKLKITQHIIWKIELLENMFMVFQYFYALMINFLHKNGIRIHIWNLYFFQRKFR